MANKDFATIAIIVLLAAAVYLVWQSSQGTDIPDNLIPSDLKTTVTLNTYDALATTPTAADVQYYIFKSNGEFYKTGETGSDGQDSVDLQYGGDYDLIAYNESNAWSSTGGGYIPVETSFQADSGEGSIKTINMKLYKVGGMTVTDVLDPVDLNSNISRTAGSTESVNVLWKVNVSNTAIYRPVLVVDYNQTGIESDGIKVSSAGWTETDCPHRLTTGSGRVKACFIYDDDDHVVLSSDGIQTIRTTIQIDDSTAVGTTSHAEYQIIDTMMYREPDYVTAGKSAFLYGQEDSADSDVGAGDSDDQRIEFNG